MNSFEEEEKSKDSLESLSPSPSQAGESDAESPAEPAEKASPAARKLEPTVLAHVLAPNYRPVKPKVIAKQLGLASEQIPALKICIRRLVKKGALAYGSGHLVCPPKGPKEKTTKPVEVAPSPPPVEAKRAAKPETQLTAAADESGTPIRKKFITPKPLKAGDITGKFKRAASGFGFVRPAGTPRSAERSGDVFIPANRTLDAASGDTVRIRLASGGKARNPKGEMRLSGEIIEIVERETSRFVGVYCERGDEAFVEIDGRNFIHPISVGDPGAKNAQPGDKVVMEMVQFPSPSQPGEGVIVEVLGARGAPGVDTLSIIAEFDLPGEFSEEVLAETREQADKFDESVEGRRDLTAETIITIDPVDARDFDDAISLVPGEKGHWLLGVHIADVSHFVRPRTKLDEAAKDRATSIYLPDRVIPMLPEIISNSLASLQPGKIRYAQTCWIEFTAAGIPVSAQVEQSAIKSCRRFTYEEVDSFLDKPAAWRDKLSREVFRLLEDMHGLAMTLRNRRIKAGAIELTLPEVKIDLDKQGRVSGAHLVQNTVSHQIIEEFMLAANEAVARILHGEKLNFLRRIHEQPALKKLQALTTFVRELGLECDSLESRFEIKRIIAEVAGTPTQHAVNYSILRSMQKAVYSPVVEGHYALHSEHYCHFTSPIRRYPDLTVHRMLNDVAKRRRPADDFAKQALLGEHCSEREQRAAEAERELIKVKLLGYMSQRIGAQFQAVITGVEEFGLFAQGIEIPAEGLIATETLEDDVYRFNRETHMLVGYRRGNQYRLGDHVRVEVAAVDVDRRELDYRLVLDPGNPRRRHAHVAPREDRHRTDDDFLVDPDAPPDEDRLGPPSERPMDDRPPASRRNGPPKGPRKGPNKGPNKGGNKRR